MSVDLMRVAVSNDLESLTKTETSGDARHIHGSMARRKKQQRLDAVRQPSIPATTLPR
ncbi:MULTISPECIES: hypothetical protein [Paraburkholderia]|nr:MULTISPECIES: hypothetical protein [Paraburkholderia]